MPVPMPQIPCGRPLQAGPPVELGLRDWQAAEIGDQYTAHVCGGIVETMNRGDLRVDETELVRTPINWILSRRFICAVRRHPTEVRLTRYGDSSTRPMGTVSRCLCGRSSTLTPP